jgi:hypothetical protein
LIEQEPDSVAPRMHSAQPLDILFEEAGASLGRIERELRLKDEARAAKFEARLAAIELAAFKAEEDRQHEFEARMAELRDGKDGEPGRDGKDADITPLISEIHEAIGNIEFKYNDTEAKIIDLVQAKIAEVKDGKDGEPGKDADMKPLIDVFEVREEKLADHFDELESTIKAKVDARLSELKDGKDGEPGRDGVDGKDADIEPFKNYVSEHVLNTLVEMHNKVDAKLAEVKDGEPGKDADIGPLTKEVEEVQKRLWEQFEAYNELYLAQIENRLAEVKDGKDGEQGPPGKDGQDGKLPIAREWTNRVHYAGDVVRHNGSTYQALADTGREPPHGDWGELASRGTDGRGFVLRGTYDASAEYRQHDVVMINRNSFAARYDNPGECPGDGWQLFGPSGQRGKEGPPGSPGPKGADGRLLSITKWEADPDEMVLRIADSTGNSFTVDLQPIAQRILEAAR